MHICNTVLLEYARLYYRSIRMDTVLEAIDGSRIYKVQHPGAVHPANELPSHQPDNNPPAADGSRCLGAGKLMTRDQWTPDLEQLLLMWARSNFGIAVNLDSFEGAIIYKHTEAQASC